MVQDYFAGSSTPVPIQTPAAISADGCTPGVDILPYLGTLCVLLSALNTAGTTPTLDIKLQTATATNLVGTVTYAGTGNGRLTEVSGGADSVAETITVTFSTATAFAVSGSVTGSMGSGVVGTRFASPQISFFVSAGSAAFVNTDAFTVPMSARTYTDIPGAAFTRVTTVASIQRLAVESDGLGNYLRAALDIGGTASPAYAASIVMLALKQIAP